MMGEVSYLNFKNPDAEFRKKVLRKIKNNFGYCPSKFERSTDTKCPCKEFNENGDCECGLFLKISVVDVTGDG